MTRRPDPPQPPEAEVVWDPGRHDDRISTTLLGLVALLWAAVTAGLVGVLAWMVWQALAVPPALAVLARVCHRIGSRLEGS